MTRKVVAKATSALDGTEVLEKARDLFSQMQKSWWEFAKLIHAIKESETYQAKGFDTFKEFCEEDYPEMHYKTILKFCSIVENWGKSIDSKIAKNEEYALPAYEACYAVISLKEDDLPKEDISKLKRDVLEKRLSYHRLREKMKELLELKRKETKEFIAKSKDDISKLEGELESQIGDDEEEEGFVTVDDSSDNMFDEFDDEELEDLAPEDFESDSDSLLQKTRKHCRDFSQTLDVLNEKIYEMTFTDETQSLYEQLDLVSIKTDETMNKIQEMR